MSRNKVANTIIITTFCAIITIVGLFSILLPKPEISESERRELAKMPEFSIASLFKGEYTSKVDRFYSDTFPFRDGFVSLSAELKEFRGLAYDGIRFNNIGLLASKIDDKDQEEQEQAPQNTPDNTPGFASASPAPTASNTAEPTQGSKPTPEPTKQPEKEPDDALFEQRNNVFIYDNAAFEVFGGSKQNSTEYANVVSRYKEMLGPSVKVYNIVVPTSVEINLPTKYASFSQAEKPFIDHIYSNLSSDVIKVNAYDEIKAHKGEYMYFRTDHHWTGLGAYYAYKAFCASAGFTPYSYEKYEKERIEGFLGTLYSATNSKALKNTPDYVEYCLPPVETEAYLYQNASLEAPDKMPLYPSYARGANSYSVFVHGDNPLFKVVNLQGNTGRKLLVIKESYGNAISPYFIPHYDELYVVDFRKFQHNIVSFIKDNGITDVVLVNNIFAANTKMHIDNINKLLFN